MRGPRLHCLFLLGVSALICGALASCGDSQSREPVASGGDPRHVNLDRLRRELKEAEIGVRYVEPSAEPLPAVVGVVRTGTNSGVGFELQVFPDSDTATVRQLGHLRPTDFGWPRERLGLIFDPRIRGVIANVAFAEYEDSVVEEHGYTRAEALASQLKEQHILRSLDDALFASLPRHDPYAQPLLPAQKVEP